MNQKCKNTKNCQCLGNRLKYREILKIPASTCRCPKRKDDWFETMSIFFSKLDAFFKVVKMNFDSSGLGYLSMPQSCSPENSKKKIFFAQNWTLFSGIKNEFRQHLGLGIFSYRYLAELNISRKSGAATVVLTVLVSVERK